MVDRSLSGGGAPIQPPRRLRRHPSSKMRRGEQRFSPLLIFKEGCPAGVGWLLWAPRNLNRNHPVTCGAPPLHKDVRVSRSAWMRESDLENKEGRKI